MDDAARVEVSVVVPLYNEKDNLADLHQQLSSALLPLGRSFEIVLVDDGSTDGSRERLLEPRRRDPRVKVIQLRRNFGQTAAITAGFDARAATIV